MPPHPNPVKVLKQSQLLESGYVLDHVGLRKSPGLVDHRIVTRLMYRPIKGPRKLQVQPTAGLPALTSLSNPETDRASCVLEQERPRMTATCSAV